MADVWHVMGDDLALSASGDLLAADGSTMTQQRVLRRLLTNKGGYIWHLGYGAGLAAFVGLPAPAAAIEAVTRRQMALEKGVGPIPAPSATVTADDTGLVALTVSYADAATNTPQSIAMTA